MDADGQHPAERIAAFMQASLAAPGAMILGDPVFDASVPLIRVRGRRISNWCTNVATLWAGIHDSLFGFRVYPIDPLVAIMRAPRWMRRFDFDAEAAVRLCLAGRAGGEPGRRRCGTCRPDEGGVSHFHYGRDNVLLTWMYLRLLLGFALRLPGLIARRLQSQWR